MEPRPRDDRPLYALAATLGLVILALLVPFTRAWLVGAVFEPLQAQADPRGGEAHGYSVQSLLFWAVLGAVFAWAAYEAVFVRWGFEPDRHFFAALAPALLLGPLLHAALVVGVLPPGSVVSYMAAEPLVYLTIAVFAGVGLALGRFAHQPLFVPILWGLLGLAPVLWALSPLVSAEGARQGLILLALALLPTLALAAAYARWSATVKPSPRAAPASAATPRAPEPFLVLVAVIGAHALDGATTWMVLRDPFGLGFEGYGERNPVSRTLVELSNGWPFFALKLALPLALLAMVRREESEPRLRAFLLFAVFVLGFGPGMANLLQVLTG